jgi:multidrug resistance efflux pump
VALAAVLVVGVVVLLLARRKTVPPPRTPSKAEVVSPSNDEVTLQGTIRPQNVTGVGADTPGFIEALLVEPGQDVFQGQVLARIGAQNLESARETAANGVEKAQDQVAKAEAAVNAARLELSRAEADATRSQMALDRAGTAFTRQQALYREGATPRLTYEKALADYQAAQKDFEIMDTAARTGRDHVQAVLREVEVAKKSLAERRDALADAQDNLSASEVRSPVDGYVVSRAGEVGKTAIEYGNKLFQIATDLYALQVVLEPKAETLKRIIPGMPALVLVLDLQSSGLQGTVKEIKDNQVIVEFASGNPAIKPGMVADVRLKFQ